jgi:hypothetical protein
VGGDPIPASPRQIAEKLGCEGELMDPIEGRIEERHLPEVLLQLARQRGCGILTVQGDQEIIGLSIFDGQLVSADALNQSLEEGLGRILTSSGLVSNDVLANLSAEHHAGGGRVVDLLLERSYIDRETLQSTLREHAYGLCVQVLRWQQGEYKFYRGDEVAFEEGVEPISVEELLIRAAAELESETLLGGLPPAGTEVYERVDSLDDALAAETLGELLAPGLTSEDPGQEIQSLLDRVDGNRTIDELARDSGTMEYRARLILWRMEQADLLRRRQSAAQPTTRQAFAVVPEHPQPPIVDLESLVGPSPITVPLPLATPRVEEEPEGPPPVAEPKPAWPATEKRPTAEPPRWLAHLLAVGMLVAVAAYCLPGPWRLLLPFPWQGDLRQAFDSERQTGIFIQVDRAAQTFFLLEGRFPESLGELELKGLLPRREVVDAHGETLGYSATATSFSLQASGGSSRTEGIAGNFLLDPEFQVRVAREESPLVLLD